MSFGVDYSFGRPGILALKKAQVKFVCRYLSAPGNAKNLSVDEAKELRAAGLQIVTVWEGTAGATLGGASAGMVDARTARQQLRALGAPANAPCYFAVDFDMQPDQLKKVLGYFAGAASILGHDRVGVYGGLRTVSACLDARVCKYAWQTDAWSGGKWDKRAHIRQFASQSHMLGGSDVDFNESKAADFGQWRTKKEPPPKKRLPRWLRFGRI